MDEKVHLGAYFDNESASGFRAAAKLDQRNLSDALRVAVADYIVRVASVNGESPDGGRDSREDATPIRTAERVTAQ